MTRDLFKNATLKMTLIYLIIIMCISLVFSFVIYELSQDELERNLKRPLTVTQKFLLDPVEERLFRIEQVETYDESQNRLRNNLVILNLLILVAGGGTAYALARRTLRPIQETHEAQSRFTADASHELRTPITAMRAETELSLTDTKLTLKKAKKQLQSNIEELDKLTSLSDSLLRLARLDHNNLEKESITVAHAVQQAVERVQMKAEQKKQLINTEKVGTESITVNQPAVVEALVTLLDNAVKYSPEKSEITISTKKHRDKVDIAVTDSGIGIKAGELAHIFERFYRADTSRTNSAEHGYGIGLSIAKAVAELHGGSIKVRSTPEHGSTFTITFPS